MAQSQMAFCLVQYAKVLKVIKEKESLDFKSYSSLHEEKGLTSKPSNGTMFKFIKELLFLHGFGNGMAMKIIYPDIMYKALAV